MHERVLTLGRLDDVREVRKIDVEPTGTTDSCSRAGSGHGETWTPARNPCVVHHCRCSPMVRVRRANFANRNKWPLSCACEVSCEVSCEIGCEVVAKEVSGNLPL